MVSVIIVNYNAGDLLRRCVDSLFKYVQGPLEVIVVDNASADDSLRTLDAREGLVIIRESTNWGFAKACNIGARRAKYDLLYFFNPDAEVRGDINDAFAMASGGEPRTIYTTRIRDEDGAYQPSYLLPLFSNLVRMLFAPGRVARWHIGASVLIGKAAFQEIGGFSEDYFIYGEDMDLFYKAYLAGMTSRQSSATIIHAQGGCSEKVWTDLERLRRVESSASIFRRKFGLSLSYFVIKHLAFVKGLVRQPAASWRELKVFWEELVKPRSNSSF